MTLENYTHITLVCDRSGSMQSVRSDAEGAVNATIKDQKEAPGAATLTLVDFDAGSFPLARGLVGQMEQNDWYRRLYDGDIKHAPEYRLIPRGGTALLDAIGQSIEETGRKLDALPESQRPSKVVIVIQTDGMENSSTRFSWNDIATMREHQESVYKWEFLFLGMGLEAAKQAERLGYRNIVSTATNDAAVYDVAYAAASTGIRNFRAGGQNLNTTVHIDEEGNATSS